MADDAAPPAQDAQSTLVEKLDEIDAHLGMAAHHQRGTATDESLGEAIWSLRELAGIVRTLVIGAAG